MRLLKAEELFQKLLEGGSKKQPRLLGLDVGSKYVGLAVSDQKNRIALPLSVLGRTKTNINLMADDFKTLVKNYSLAGLVVGYPFNLQGQSSPDASQVSLLVGELCKTGKLDDLSYTYWDENFTSKCVEALLNPLKLNDPVETKTMTDKFAAVCILQGYLDNMNRALRSADKCDSASGQ
ncbi:putative pre-16S rRNA nuclease [Triticum urartu]|uniref:YqgF/RNase H-like domain-containing protein n=1 Tax=Triticum urartu TaxID=4572 RepID=A0A8R7TXF5_TRIUA|nr:putative pre-16S rRNA nuclease [Triticum urartu]XP_048564604.1 putative pre-16S rRNA nuclease [Triticum urartu]